MIATSEISIGSIESKCKQYADKRMLLSSRMIELQSELAAVTKKHIAGIKSASTSCQDLQAQLREMIKEGAPLFTKPKSYTFHGVKVGFVKGKGKIDWEMEDAELCKRIRKLFDEEAADRLIITTEKPSKDALAGLSAGELKKLGITIEEAGEQIVVKTTDSEVDKLVAKLLAEGAQPIEETN